MPRPFWDEQFAFCLRRLAGPRHWRALTGLMVLWAASSIVKADEIRIQPSQIDLVGRFARSQLVVLREASKSADTFVATVDLTSQAKVRSQDEKIVTIEPSGYVVPVGNGSTKIVVDVGGKQILVPVTVRGAESDPAIDFRNDVEPILTRFGCNAGGCHGKASGQNGFKLSLFGFDAQYDYDEIVKRARGRRVNITAPEQSLLIAKAVNAVAHGGGKRFEIGSEPYRILEAWVAAGAPTFAKDAPVVTSLKMFPSQQIMANGGHQQLAVTAVYSDGTVRDVTRSASFRSNLDVLAKVDDHGQVETLDQSGEAAVMAQYMGQVAVFRAIVPHGAPRKEIPDFAPVNYVDQLVVEKWKKLGLLPSPVCDDATFLRRATLDICGRLPTVDEAKAFAADQDANKRDKLIDRLLDSPDYPAFFALRWSVILRNSQLAGANQAAIAFHNWIRESIAQNRPYDDFVRGVVAAAGEWPDAPAVNWLWQNRDDQLHQTTADVAQVFLGTRLQCARCHHHPYEKWGQEDYFGLAGFFTRLGRKSFGEPPPYFSASTVTISETNPVTGKQAEPKFLAGEYVKFAAEEDPRHGLVDWMTKPENPFFAKAFVNRMWAHFMGRGLVHEVDDLRDTNPASNPELLDALAKDFVDHHFDTKHILRVIAKSRVYQLSAEPREENKHDRQNYARYYARRMIAEVFLDSVDQLTGSRSRFGGVAASSRAVDLPHEGFGSSFLDAFDRPKRVTVCECERSSGATLAQVLLLSNSDEIENKVADGNGRVAKLIEAKRPVGEAIDELYLAAFSRLPDPSERTTVIGFVERAKNQREALEDVEWSLLNSREFMFQH